MELFLTQSQINHNVEASELQGFQRTLDEFFRLDFKNRIYDNPELFNNDKLTAVINRLKAYNTNGTPFGYHITVNVKYNDPDKLLELGRRLATKSFIKHALFAIEFRGDQGDGNHLHLYIRSQNRPLSQIKREFQSSTASHIGNPRHCHIQCITKEHERRVLKYILKSSATDQEWRKQYTLADGYASGIFEKFVNTNKLKIKIKSLTL